MSTQPQSPYTSHLFVKNIHCPSCVSYAKDVLRHLPGIQRIDISLIDHNIRVQHVDETSHTIASELIRAAFEVEHVTVVDSSGRQIYDYETQHDDVNLPPRLLRWRVFMSKTQRQHYENCVACREERKMAHLSMSNLRSVLGKRKSSPILPVSSEEHISTQPTLKSEKVSPTPADGHSDSAEEVNSYVATILIEGMTCASCVSSVTKEIEKLDGVESINVNLLAGSAKIQFRGPKSQTAILVGHIEDIGFEAEIQAVDLLFPASNAKIVYKASLSVEGMTCGSCVGTVKKGLESIQSVKSVDVDLISNSATISYSDKNDIDRIVEMVEDMGFEAAVVNIEESRSTSTQPTADTKERTVEIQVDGMYCTKCPDKINLAVREAFSGQVVIKRDMSMKIPRLKIVYKPSVPTMTLRTFTGFINSLDPAYRSSFYHPPSLEERSRNIKRKERNRILRHLLLTFLIAIPTFVIGVVYMSLVSAHDATRQWFEKSIWAGTAMRSDWALFILTTPVMFYGTAIFHLRALKEIWSLWRPKSKVPILRRFYRFGSMNLLISAGTSVAYFSSLAILIMDATSPKPHPESDETTRRHSTTYFDTVTFLTLFILCGRFLEAYSKAKTGDAISMLSNLRPIDALLLEKPLSELGDMEKHILSRVSVDLLEVGDIVSIPHGTCPPMDGIVNQEGSFLFDESSLTGEARPVKKVMGDKVYTGTVNISDPVRIQVTEIGGKSMLDQIVNVVREGQAKRAPIERLADLLTGYFTPVITLLAIITWIIWLVLGESGALPRSWLDVERGGWAFWSVEFAIAVFVVACPCGIGLAAPTALFVGGGLAAKHGILVQGGGEAFQEASKLNAIVFDKTGTLTEGKMKVTDIDFVEAKEKQESDLQILAFELAKSLEESSTHPIAKAIVDFCAAKLENKSDLAITRADIKEIPGQGMTGEFEVRLSSLDTITVKAIIGNERLYYSFQREGHIKDNTLDQKLSSYQSSGHSTALFCLTTPDTSIQPKNSTVLFAITDPIRPEAPAVLSSLQARGVSVHMCTGDNPTTAHAIARQLGIPISNVRAGALPQDKAAYIQQLQHPSSSSSLSSTSSSSASHSTQPTLESQTKPIKPSNSKTRQIIAFLGDGTNDTPALTQSDISIALSHPSTSDIAITTSSFILLNSNLTSILILVSLSHRVFQRVKFNFLWAGIYNIILIPVAAGVFFGVGADEEKGGWRLNPVWASAAMAGSSVSVVLSSLALRLPEMKWRVGERGGFGEGEEEEGK